MRALININIKRLTFDIPFDLPAPIFGLNDFKSNYRDTVKGTLPQGCILKSATVGDPDSPTLGNEFVCLTYFYTYGFPPTDVEDKIYISCNEIPYSSLLYSTASSNFEVEKIGYQLTDNISSRQLNQRINLTDISLFGKKIVDSYTPNQFRTDMVKLNDFIEIPVKQKITADTNFGLSFTKQVSLTEKQFSVSLHVKKLL